MILSRLGCTALSLLPPLLPSWQVSFQSPVLRGLSLFMLNWFLWNNPSCQVTSYSPSLHSHGAVWQWQLATGATWSNLPSPSGLVEAGMVVPTLKAFTLRPSDGQELILAAGDQEAVVISPGGSVLAIVDLPASPTHALITEDFSNDGLTDLILVTNNGIYGFVQTRQPGALFFSTLVGCLILVMGVIFVTQHLNSMKGKPRASAGRQ